MPIKVLYIISDSSFGGASRHLFDLLTNLDKKKIQPILLSRPSPILARLKNKLKTYAVEMKSRLDLGAIKNIKKIIGQEKPDLIHLHSTRAGILGALAAKNLGIPIIYTEHLFTHEYQPHNRLIHYWQLQTFRLLAPKIDKVIAVSRAVKKYLSEKKIFPAEKIEVIHHGSGINLKLKTPPTLKKVGVPTAIVGEISKPQHETGRLITIGSIGTLTKIKGYKYLVRSVQDIDNVKVEIIGKGPDLERLQQLDINKKVKFWGEQEDIDTIIARWKIYIQPSLAESFGLALAEAMAAGLPVIASNVGGVPELVSRAGILIKPMDSKSLASAIIKLVNNTGLRRKLGKMAKDRIKRYFSADKMVNKIEGLYAKILKTRPGLK